MIKTELNCQASGKTNPAPLQISHLGKNIIRMGLSQGLEWEGKVRRASHVQVWENGSKCNPRPAR